MALINDSTHERCGAIESLETISVRLLTVSRFDHQTAEEVLNDPTAVICRFELRRLGIRHRRCAPAFSSFVPLQIFASFYGPVGRSAAAVVATTQERRRESNRAEIASACVSGIFAELGKKTLCKGELLGGGHAPPKEAAIRIKWRSVSERMGACSMRNSPRSEFRAGLRNKPSSPPSAE